MVITCVTEQDERLLYHLYTEHSKIVILKDTIQGRVCWALLEALLLQEVMQI